VEVLRHLERHRAAIAASEEKVRAEARIALARVEQAYGESGLPAPYLRALVAELESAVPERWRAVAAPFSELEARGFGIWRNGDFVARVVYVFTGLCVGGLCVAAPFIPIWEKWFPFALSIAGYFLPDAQMRWQRRRYARQLGEVVRDFAALQPRLEEAVKLTDLLGEVPAGEKTGGKR